MNTQTITLRFANYHTEVEASVYGNFGVHKDGNTYTVTHIPSGMMARNGIRLKRHAVNLAKRFAAINADTSTADMPFATKGLLIEAMREWIPECSR